MLNNLRMGTLALVTNCVSKIFVSGSGVRSSSMATQCLENFKKSLKALEANVVFPLRSVVEELAMK